MKKEDYIITDQLAICKALGYDNAIIGCLNFIPLVPIGYAKFKGDNLPIGWSFNPFFEIGKTYPIYQSDESSPFPIGSDGIGKKMVYPAWSKIKYF